MDDSAGVCVCLNDGEQCTGILAWHNFHVSKCRLLVSTMPKTQTSLEVVLPQWYCDKIERKCIFTHVPRYMCHFVYHLMHTLDLC